MPILKDQSKVERFYLPSTEKLPEEEKAFVDLDIGPVITGDVVGADLEAGEVKVGVQMLTDRIKGWNYTNESGEPLEINFDNVKLLDMDDFVFLAQQLPTDKVEGLTAPEKKT